MSQTEVKKVLDRLSRDSSFRARLGSNPAKALAQYRLTKAEVKAISSIPSDELQGFSSTMDMHFPGDHRAATRIAASKLAASKLAGSKLAGSKLAGSKLAGSKLAGSKLAGSKLAGSKLAGSKIAGSKLAGSKIAGSIVR